VVVCKFAPLAGKPIPQVTMESLLAYDADNGARRGMLVPIDLQRERADVRSGSD
jgi:hypothetical protein